MGVMNKFRCSVKVLYYDNHMVIVNKPSGLVVHEDGAYKTSLRSWVERWVATTYNKTGTAFVVPVHRLDRLTSGIVVFAKTDKALSRLTKLFRKREVKKYYLLRTKQGENPPSDGLWVDYLLRQESLSIACKKTDPGAKEAIMRVSQLAVTDSFIEWQAELLTGRHHQIRAQFASRGYPILGDKKYGGIGTDEEAIFLHHYKIEFTHPIAADSKRKIEIVAPKPFYWV